MPAIITGSDARRDGRVVTGSRKVHGPPRRSTSRMEYRQFGRTGTRVSELYLGTMTFGNEADEATSQQIVARFPRPGGNSIDPANVYSQGVSEEITGRAIKGKRDQIVLATKARFAMGGDTN